MKNLLTLFLFFVAVTGVSQPASDATLRHNKFALNVYKACVAEKKNLFISPYSLRIILLATAEGARGNTRQRFDSLVALGDLAAAKQLIHDMNNNDNFFERKTLNVANAIWMNNTIPVEKTFIDILKREYQSEYFPFDPASMAGVGDEINQWVSQKTQGKITSMPPPGSSSAFALLNAVYFSDNWANSFKRKKTKPKPFHSNDGNKQTLDFMNTTANFKYFGDNELQALTMSYRSRFSMIVLLPRDIDGLTALEKHIDEILLSKIISGSRLHPTTVSFPKFTITNELELTSTLSAHGFDKLFRTDADLRGISSSANLQIGELIHKTFISVDEKETKATAVTEEVVIVAGVGAESPPPPEPKFFKANHPFLFVIVDSMTDTIVFAGRFVGDE